LYPASTVFCGIEGNNIEPHRIACVLRMPGEKDRRCINNSVLFSTIDRPGCRSKTIPHPVAHLDKRQAFSMSHDQIDLAMSAAKIALYKL